MKHGSMFTNYNYFFKGIIYISKRSLFLCDLGFILHPIRRLNIVSSATEITDKVYLILSAHLLSIFSYDNRHHTYIYIESSDSQLIVYNILHSMAEIRLSEIHSCIS